jgi:molybdopterin-containing oxidoreductase family iron-sulfur binding subunit
MSGLQEPVDLEAVRTRLACVHGQEYWRSLEELAQSNAFLDLLAREAPQLARELPLALDRRKFLALMGASLALAGMSGCSQAPTEQIVPYVRQPEEVVPGRPLYFATAMPMAGYASGGLLVESHLGRPTKVEGNPDHPFSAKPVDSASSARFGPSDLFAQASILGLYDPDRSQTIRYRHNQVSSWEEFQSDLEAVLRGQPGQHTNLRRRSRDLRLRILTGTITSPTLLKQIQRILERFPRASWHVYEPASESASHEGARLAFLLPPGGGNPEQGVDTYYRLDQADVILSLDADFLAWGPGKLRYARDFAARRRIRDSQATQYVNRLYVAECCPSLTGAKADHRVPMQAWQVERFARAVAIQLGIEIPRTDRDSDFGLPSGWVAALAADLRNALRGRAVVIPGDGQPAAVHALAQAMNERLGAFGVTVVHTAPIAPRPDEDAFGPFMPQMSSLHSLVQAIDQGHVDILVILGVNPTYNAPADLRFDNERLARVPLLIHLGLYQDETAFNCHWHIPEAHYLESWGDVRALDGTVSVIQPLIAPLYRGKTATEVLAILTGQPQRSAYEIVSAHWREIFSRAGATRDEGRRFANLNRSTGQHPGDFEGWWRRILHDGWIPGTEAPVLRDLRVRGDLGRALGSAPAQPSESMELVFRPDPALFDGSFANNGWLQELPKPLSHLTWGNAAFMSPATARHLGLSLAEEAAEVVRANGQEVALVYQGRQVSAPVWVLPGHADNSVTVYLGNGRTRAGRVGNDVGFDAYRLRTWAAPWFDSGLEVRTQGRRTSLATTQHHYLMENRDLVRSGTVQDYGRISREQEPNSHPRRTISLYPDHPYEGRQWGMSINLNLCTGCSACVVACQAENNIPVVGKDQVLRGREMHWLRVDTFYKGDPAQPLHLETYSQPVPCMHCENAPCELVCPVEATVHSDDGLNDMVYNRCVGTRYCSNNCPYKVRRFNFLQRADFDSEALRLGGNPNVTVRSRGVMEKCTYCVQRIRQGEIEANVAERQLQDGDIQTACQAACPAGAIVFGDLNLVGSLVRRLQDLPVNYGLLADTSTRPRTTYLWAFKNPNRAILQIEGRPGG